MDDRNEMLLNGQTQTDREIGEISVFVIVGSLLVLFGLLFWVAFVIAFLVAVGFIAFKKTRVLTWVSLASFLGFLASLYFFKITALWQFVALGDEKLPTQVVGFLQKVLNDGTPFSLTWQSWLMMILLGTSLARVVALLIDRVQTNWLVRTKDEDTKSYLASPKYKKVLKTRESITNKQQNTWRNAKDNGNVYLGADIKGSPVYMPIKQLFTHMLIQGTTGAGKTVAMLSYVEEALRRGMPVYYVEAKGDAKIKDNLQTLANKYERRLRVFGEGSMTTYNPLKNGDASTVEQRLMEVFDWSEQFYKNASDDMLLKVIKFMEAYDITRDLDTLSNYLDLKRIYKVLNNDAEVTTKTVVKKSATKSQSQSDFGGADDEPAEVTETKEVRELSAKAQKFMRWFFDTDYINADELDDWLDDNRHIMKNITGLRTQIELLTISNPGEFLRDSDDEIDVSETLNSSDIVLFSFNSNKYGTLTPQLGRLVVSDVATAVTEKFNNDEFNGAIGVFDEFGSYANDKIIDVLAKARSAKFGAILGVQSIYDLMVDGNAEMLERIKDNVNSFMLGRSNSEKSAEIVAGMVGTFEDVEKTIVTENKGGLLARIDTKADRGTMRNVKRFILAPDEIKDMPNYTFFVVRKDSADALKTKVYARNVMNGLK